MRGATMHSNHPFTAARLIACLALVLAFQARADVFVVVNAANMAALDDAAVAKIFLKQVKSFPDGSAATPVALKEGPVSDEFRTRYLKKNASQFKAFWAQQVFTGGGKQPQELDSDEAVLKFVAETPGAIAYVGASKAHPGVKFIGK